MHAIADCLRRAMDIRGAIGVSLVDYTTGLALGTLGGRPYGDAASAATSAAEVIQSALQTAAYAPNAVAGQLNGDGVEDVILTTGGSYHLLRLIRTGFDSRLILHLWLDRTDGNLAMARQRINMLAEDLVGDHT